MKLKRNSAYLMLLTTVTLLLLINTSAARGQNLSEGLEVGAEVSATASNGDLAPLWLMSNRQGTVSPEANSAYERVWAIRQSEADTMRQWKIGYGIDLQTIQHGQSDVFVQQAFVELRWKKLYVMLGQKEREIDLRNNRLTSGGLSQGINARPIPELLGMMDYFDVPGTKGWWQMRGRFGYGMTTDGAWQKRWIGNPDEMKYTSNTLYHEKALYWKFGRKDKLPLTFEIGLQMMTQFGGTTYNPHGRGVTADMKKMEHSNDLNAFWHAFALVGSNDATDGVNKNAQGNTVGSYNMALTWEGDGWQARAYFERLFEDQSMLTVQYGIYDHLLGLDVKLPTNPYVSNVLVEHLSTTHQSGPVFHDTTTHIAEGIAGWDNYYNHNLYTGWQHWGQPIGTPLITSPLYNENRLMYFRNSRVKAWHVGLDGRPSDEISWRALLTFTRNWGTYTMPLDDQMNEHHLLAEVSYSPRWLSGWSSRLGIAWTRGDLSGNSAGCQLTIRKELKF